MRNKSPTTTWIHRHKGGLTGRTERELKEAYFGHQIEVRAQKIKTQVSGLMTPSFIAEDDLDSGMQMNDMYLAMLKLILFPADLMAKITLSVKRMPNVQGERNSYGSNPHVIMYIISNR